MSRRKEKTHYSSGEVKVNKYRKNYKQRSYCTREADGQEREHTAAGKLGDDDDLETDPMGSQQ